jgi:hypothetical protein
MPVGTSAAPDLITRDPSDPAVAQIAKLAAGQLVLTSTIRCGIPYGYVSGLIVAQPPPLIVATPERLEGTDHRPAGTTAADRHARRLA